MFCSMKIFGSWKVLRITWRNKTGQYAMNILGAWSLHSMTRCFEIVWILNRSASACAGVSFCCFLCCCQWRVMKEFQSSESCSSLFRLCHCSIFSVAVVMYFPLLGNIGQQLSRPLTVVVVLFWNEKMTKDNKYVLQLCWPWYVVAWVVHSCMLDLARWKTCATCCGWTVLCPMMDEQPE